MDAENLLAATIFTLLMAGAAAFTTCPETGEGGLARRQSNDG